MQLLDYIVEQRSLSKRKAKALIDSRCIFVNGKRVWMAKHPISPSDRIEIHDRAEHQDKEISLLYRDAFYVVAKKPAGLLSNDDPKSLEQCLRTQLNCPQLQAVHRLDRDTSGALIYALTDKSCETMLDLFRKRKTKKIYIALTAGSWPARIQSCNQQIDGKSALTLFNIIDRNRQASLLEIELKTGRRHQIRKHCSALKHPILGDSHYGLKTGSNARYRDIPRQMLHAWKLEFKSPMDGKEISIKCDVPEEMLQVIKNMELNSPKS